MTREDWLNIATKALRPQFTTLPERVLVSCGFGSKRSALGQWHNGTSSRDKVSHQVFISPVLDEPLDVLATLVHELCHAALTGTGHRAPFQRLATSHGLVGPWKATKPGPNFRERYERVLALLGPYPHPALSLGEGKKQTTRMLKAECGNCGYTVRITRKWVDHVGPPHCPDHGEMNL